MDTTTDHPSTIPVTAAQVGKYFLGQYYNMIQTQPDYVQHFYTSSSTMLRTDGTTRLTATSLPQIHALVMSLHYTRLEIESAHSLESWKGGILVIVTGQVQSEDFKRKFVETFFLAPQDKGYFVLNNIFHIIDDELLDLSLVQTDQAPEYMVDGETRVWDCASPTSPIENGPAGKFNFTEQQLQQIYEAKRILKRYSQFDGSILDSPKLMPPPEEVTEESQNHTYASIVAKNKSATPQPPLRKSTSDHIRKSIPSSTATYKFGRAAAVEVSTVEGELKSVYVKNLPSTVTPIQVEEVFKKFGRLKSDEGVCIKNREDIGVCYGFVEFEDASGVRNAIKASKVKIAGKQVIIEERRPDGDIKYRGRGKGRGKGRHSKEAAHGGQGSGRGQSFYRAVSN